MANNRVTVVGAYIELSGGTGEAVTTAAAYVETSPNLDNLFASLAGAYVEMQPASGQARVNLAGAYIELTPSGSSNADTPAGTGEAYVAGVVGLAAVLPRGMMVNQLLVYAELINRHLYATKFFTLVEIALEDLRVTKLMNLIEIEYSEPPEPLVPTHFPRNAGARSMHRLIPDEVSGYPFDPLHSWWTIIVPEETENLIITPSFEDEWGLQYNDFGFTLASSLPSNPVGAVAGMMSVRLVTDAAEVPTFTYTGGATAPLSVVPGPYTWSLYIYPTRIGDRVTMQIWQGGSFPVAQRQFEFKYLAWQRIELSYVALAAGTVTLSLNFGSGEARTYYTDAWQFEAKAYATTYCDGDMLGWNDRSFHDSYSWRGSRHFSTSVRRKTTGSGGRPIRLSDELHFWTTSVIGLGMAPVEHRLRDLADGSEEYLRSDMSRRDFTINGVLFGRDHRELSQRRQELIDLIRPNHTVRREQLILQYQPVDQTGYPYGIPLQIVCAYKAGLEGNTTNFHQERLAIQFHAADPSVVEDIESSQRFSWRKTLPYDELFMRDEDGVFQNLSYVSGDVITWAHAVGVTRDGDVLVAGTIPTLGGVSVNNLGRWDGTDWESFAGGTNNRIYALETSEEFDGIVAIGGDFTTASGNAAIGAAYYTELAGEFVQADDGVNDTTFDIRRASDGYFYFTGEFTGPAGYVFGSNTDPEYVGGILRFDPYTNTMTPLGKGVSGTVLHVNTVCDGQDGYLYFGGSFEVAMSTVQPPFPQGNIARWNLETEDWEYMAGTFYTADGSGVSRILRAEDGTIYALGDFTRNSTNTYDVRGFAKWTGEIWEEVFPLGEMHSMSYLDMDMVMDKRGVIWFYNKCTSQYFDVPEYGLLSMFGWKNGTFYPQFWSLDEAGDIYGLDHVYFDKLNRGFFLRRGLLPHPTLYVPYSVELDYGGNADCNPTVVIMPDQWPMLIESYTTHQGIYFREEARTVQGDYTYVVTDGVQPKLISSTGLNRRNWIAAGPTSLKNFVLKPGINHLNFFGHWQVPLNEYNTLKWRNRYWGLDSSIQ